MPITPPKPTLKSNPSKAATTAAEKDIERIIKKGGSSPSSKPDPALEKRKPVLLKLSPSVLSEVDSLVAERKERIRSFTRIAWLEEAVAEKLDRDGGGT